MKTTVPVFFASDKRYLPFLTVSIKSLADTAVSDCEYRVYVLTNDLTEEDFAFFKNYERDNLKIERIDVSDRLKEIKGKLSTRDYYSVSIYFRLFIPVMFKQYDKVIYLDSDITVVNDVAKMYNEDVGDAYLGAVLDETVYTNQIFCTYVEDALDVSRWQYFNSGVLIMNLKQLREFDIETRFYRYLNNFGFNTVAPDQDFLNITCKGKVHYLDKSWNQQPLQSDSIAKTPNLVHYNMFFKPWHYDNVLLENYFWAVAKETPFYGDILKIKAEYTEERQLADKKAAEDLLAYALEICASKNTYVVWRNRQLALNPLFDII